MRCKIDMWITQLAVLRALLFEKDFIRGLLVFIALLCLVINRTCRAQQNACPCSLSTGICVENVLRTTSSCESSLRACEACNCDVGGELMCDIAEVPSLDSSCNTVPKLVARCPCLNRTAVAVEGNLVGCIEPWVMTSDVNEAYEFRGSKGGETKMNKDLVNQYIHIRMVYVDSLQETYLCFIYGAGNNSDTSNTKDSEANLVVSSFDPVAWVLMDDDQSVEAGG